MTSMRMLAILDRLDRIDDRLTAIETSFNRISNPLAHVTAVEKGQILGRAIKTGDKKKIRAAIAEINRRSLQ